MDIEIKNVRNISYDDAELEISRYIHNSDHYVYVSELAENLCIDLELIEKIHNKIYDVFFTTFKTNYYDKM